MNLERYVSLIKVEIRSAIVEILEEFE